MQELLDKITKELLSESICIRANTEPIINLGKAIEIVCKAFADYNNGWIPFVLEYDEDEEIEMLQGRLPDDEEEILVTNGKHIWTDTFMRDGIECYLDNGTELVNDAIAWQPIAWQPLPEPWRKKNNANRINA